MDYLLGVDGGGTKMLAALARLDGTIVKKAKAGPANYHAVGVAEVQKNMQKLLDKLVKGDVSRLKSCCLGFSGCGRPSDYKVLNPMLKKLKIFPKTLLVGDMAVGLMGGALEPKGIIIIAGTGSIVFGINEKGKSFRAGGYGNWFADEGSGFRLGHKALCSIMKAKDGRINPVAFQKPALKLLGLKKPDDLISWAAKKNKEGMIKTEMATVAPLVIAAAEKRDAMARRIIKEEVAELVDMVKTVVKAMKALTLPQVVLVGGVVENNPYYFRAVKNGLRREIKGLKVISPKSSPAVGAVIGAAQKAGIEITPGFIKNLTGSWKKINK